MVGDETEKNRKTLVDGFEDAYGDRASLKGE